MTRLVQCKTVHYTCLHLAVVPTRTHDPQGSTSGLLPVEPLNPIVLVQGAEPLRFLVRSPQLHLGLELSTVRSSRSLGRGRFPDNQSLLRQRELALGRRALRV